MEELKKDTVGERLPAVDRSTALPLSPEAPARRAGQALQGKELFFGGVFFTTQATL